jgi:alkylation response protein AidB-like acyl-CoA dehydrogenase
VGNNTGLYALTDEHEAIREAVRDIAEREIAPFAAEVDADSRYPIEAQKALTTAGFHATHIPEAYGGEGADAIATCIVIEEVARVDCSASLIPAVNKLGSMPIILSASEDVKQLVLPPIASGKAMISYGLSEREAGSDAAAMKNRARLEGDIWVLNGTKAWITNSGVSEWYTVMAVTDPEKGANGISAFAVHRDDPGFAVGPKERKMGSRARPPASSTSPTARSRPTGSSEPPAPGSRPRSARWTSPGRPSARRPWASPRARWTPRSPTSRTAGSSARASAASRACSSCSPTWR